MRGNSCWMRSHIVGKSLENPFPSSHLRHGNPGGVRSRILIDVMINSCICFPGEPGTRSMFHIYGNWNIIFYYVLFSSDRQMINQHNQCLSLKMAMDQCVSLLHIIESRLTHLFPLPLNKHLPTNEHKALLNLNQPCA